jgi:hypothetical protein
MVLRLPIDVVVCVVLSVVVCPGVVHHKGTRAPGVAVTARDRAVTIFLTEAMGVRASVAAMPPCVAVPTVAVLGAGGSVVPDFVTGAATRPGLEVSGAVSANMTHMAAHGAEVVHVDDWGGRRDRWRVPKCGGAWGEGDSDGHRFTHVVDWGGGRTDGELEEGSGGLCVLDKGDIDGQRGGGTDGVGGGGLSWTLIRRVVLLSADGTGGRGGLALSLVLLLVLSSVRWDRNGA